MPPSSEDRVVPSTLLRNGRACFCFFFFSHDAYVRSFRQRVSACCISSCFSVGVEGTEHRGVSQLDTPEWSIHHHLTCHARLVRPNPRAPCWNVLHCESPPQQNPSTSTSCAVVATGTQTIGPAPKAAGASHDSPRAQMCTFEDPRASKPPTIHDKTPRRRKKE